MKICNNCAIKKELNDFYKDKRTKDGLYSVCKKCHLLKTQVYQKYYHKTDKYKASRKIYIEKWLKNPKNRIDSAMTTMVANRLQQMSKYSSIEKILGFTLGELRKHLESKFTKEMTWDNYGSYWTIDHIIPKKAFKYESTEDAKFKECWSLRNLRPLRKEDNIKKRDKIITI